MPNTEINGSCKTSAVLQGYVAFYCIWGVKTAKG